MRLHRGDAAAASRPGSHRGRAPGPPPRGPPARPCPGGSDRPRSQCQARSAVSSASEYHRRAAGSESSACATCACRRARRVGDRESRTASRVSAWTKVKSPTSASSTRPEDRAASRSSSTSSRSRPPAAAIVSARKPLPTTAASRSVSRARGGRSASRRATTSRTPPGTSSPPGDVDEPGQLGEEERVARRASVPVRRGRGGHLRTGHADHQGPGLREVEATEVDAERAAAGPAPRPPPPAHRWARGGSGGCRPGRDGRAPAAPTPGGARCAGSRRRPSAGRPARPAAAVSAARSRSAVAIRSAVSNAARAGLSSVGAASGGGSPRERSTPSHGHSGGAPSSCEQVPRATWKPWPAAACSRSASSQVLPIPGSPTSTRAGGRACRGGRQEGVQRGPLRLASDGGRRRRSARGSGHRRGRSGSRDGGIEGAVEPGVLLEDRPLELAQLRAGVQPQLVGQQLADGAQAVQRLGLATGAGQGQGVQRPPPFLQRVGGDPRLRGRQRARVLTERQQPQQPGLLADHPRLLQRGALGHHVRVVLEIGVRLAAPRGECRVEVLERGRHGGPVGPPGGVAGRELGGQRRQGALEPAYVGDEAVGVDVIGGDAEHVAVVGRLEHRGRGPRGALGLQDLAQPGDVGVQGAVGGPRRLTRPDQVGQRVGGDRPAGMQRQGRDDRAGFAGAEVQPRGLAGVVRPRHPHAPQHVHPHGRQCSAEAASKWGTSATRDRGLEAPHRPEDR